MAGDRQRCTASISMSRPPITVGNGCGKQVLPIDIRRGDALASEPPLPLGTFDAVLANPPYVSIRELARQHTTDYIRGLRQRFHTARGNFDLYVLFIERAPRVAPPRRTLRADRAEQVGHARLCPPLPRAVGRANDDRSSGRSVGTPRLSRGERLSAPAGLHEDESSANAGRPRRRCDSCTADRCSSNRKCRRSLSAPSCGCRAARQAMRQRRSARCCAEAEAAASPALPFITSGNIDRYAIRTGNVRYQSRLWRDPSLAVRRRQRNRAATAALRLTEDRHRRPVAPPGSGVGRPRLGARRAGLCGDASFRSIRSICSRCSTPSCFRISSARASPPSGLAADMWRSTRGNLDSLPIAIRRTASRQSTATNCRHSQPGSRSATGDRLDADAEIDRTSIVSTD